MLMTFADRLLGMTAWYANEQKPQATVHLDVHFIDAVQIGDSSRRDAASCAAPARSSS